MSDVVTYGIEAAVGVGLPRGRVRRPTAARTPLVAALLAVAGVAAVVHAAISLT